MGIFTYNQKETMLEEDLKILEDVNYNEFMENVIYYELSKLSSDDLHEFINSEAAEALCEAGAFKKPTLVRLGKTDDLERRIGMAALQIAKDKNDPLWDKLAMNRVKEKQLLGQIKDKYSSPATRLAKDSQRDYIKNFKNKIPLGFMRK